MFAEQHRKAADSIEAGIGLFALAEICLFCLDFYNSAAADTVDSMLPWSIPSCGDGVTAISEKYQEFRVAAPHFICDVIFCALK